MNIIIYDYQNLPTFFIKSFLVINPYDPILL